MPCNIKWNSLNFPEWNERFSQLNRATLLQSYSYAQAIAEVKSQKPRWGIIEIDGKEAGLIQIFEVGLLKNLIHAVILDRGPLWFEGFGNKEHIEEFFVEFNRLFPNRLGRKRRVIPETGIDLTPFGYTKSGEAYETIWINLRKSEDGLRKDLKKNWRGTLTKAEKSDIKVEWDEKGEHFSWLMQNYVFDREQKGYSGPSVKLLTAMAKYHNLRGELLIGRAILDGEPIAGTLILKHGCAATYQIGFSTDAGRRAGAHHIILWQALLHLKDLGTTDFDLGGINDETAKGVKQFKAGMGGEKVKLASMYS